MDALDWILTAAGLGGLAGVAVALRKRLPGALRAAAQELISPGQAPPPPPVALPPGLTPGAPSREPRDVFDLLEHFTGLPLWMLGREKAVVGPDGRPIAVNPALCSFLGAPEYVLTQRPFSAFSAPGEDLDQDLEQYRRVVEGLIDHYGIERRRWIRQSDGAIVTGRLVVIVLPGVTWRGRGPVCVAEVDDLTREVSLEAEVASLRAEVEAMLVSADKASSGETPKLDLPPGAKVHRRRGG